MNAVFNSGVVSNDLSIRPVNKGIDLLRIYSGKTGPSLSDEYLSFTGYYDNQKQMFKISSKPIAEGENQYQNGCSMTLDSESTRVSVNSSNTEAGISFINWNTNKSASLSLRPAGDLALQLPGYGLKKLSWKSNGDGTYTLIGQ
jgi:hypothetical protein